MSLVHRSPDRRPPPWCEISWLVFAVGYVLWFWAESQHLAYETGATANDSRIYGFSGFFSAYPMLFSVVGFVSCLLSGSQGKQARRWFLQRAPLRLLVVMVISLGTGYATSHITDTIDRGLRVRVAKGLGVSALQTWATECLSGKRSLEPVPENIEALVPTGSVEISKDTPDTQRHIQIRQAGGRASGWTLRVGPPTFRPQLGSSFRVIEWQPGVYATYWIGGDSS